MSYCVHCGVELHPTAPQCPLCSTPVCDPLQPIDTHSPTPFPLQRAVIERPHKGELALLLSAMLASVAVVCALLNFFFFPQRLWSLYVIGGAVMLWLWFVPPLLFPKIPLWLRLLVDVGAVGVYVFLISLDWKSVPWFLGLALPVILAAAAVAIFLGLVLQKGRRSILSSIILILGSTGFFLVGVELFVDTYLHGLWQPDWSLLVLAICVALMIPLIVVRRVPGLREEARRKFHM